jgi:hypothetical protein
MHLLTMPPLVKRHVRLLIMPPLKVGVRLVLVRAKMATMIDLLVVIS